MQRDDGHTARRIRSSVISLALVSSGLLLPHKNHIGPDQGSCIAEWPMRVSLLVWGRAGAALYEKTIILQGLNIINDQ